MQERVIRTSNKKTYVPTRSLIKKKEKKETKLID